MAGRRVEPPRRNGFEKLFLMGNESFPLSQFAIYFNEFKKRIEEEQHAYSRNELRQAHDLVKLVNSLQILYVSQDHPLSSTESGYAVNQEALRQIMEWEEPLLIDELPSKERDMYCSLYSRVSEVRKERDNLLNEYVGVEKFLYQQDYASQFGVSCLLGMSNRVRDSLDKLSRFNMMIGRRVDVVGQECHRSKMYKVNHVLNGLEELRGFHKSNFNDKFVRRKGNYEYIFSEFSPFSAKKFSEIYNFNFLPLIPPAPPPPSPPTKRAAIMAADMQEIIPVNSTAVVFSITPIDE